MPKMHKVFVYGTLMHGQPNHYLLKGADFAGFATSKERYHVMSMGGFPAVVTDPEHNNWKVEGELYLCNQTTLNRLDKLESNGWLYLRRMRPFRVLVEDREQKRWVNEYAWIYELLHENRTEQTPLVCNDFTVYGDQITIWDPKDTDWWR